MGICVMRSLARLYLALFGWKPEGDLPLHAKYVLVAAPHTSNWDLPVTLAFGFLFGLRVKWMGKRELFRRPFGALFRALGGIPVDRSGPRGAVDAIVALFERSDALVMVIPPEGTRGARDHWKSGFYHVAAGARVPIVLGFLDYARRRGGFGPSILPSGDLTADMDRVRAFYAGIQGRYPERFQIPRLREEDASVEIRSAAS